MAISVTKPASTIIVTGGTEGTPATWNDIYLADVGGGWGLVAEVVTDAVYRAGQNTFLSTIYIKKNRNDFIINSVIIQNF